MRCDHHGLTGKEDAAWQGSLLCCEYKIGDLEVWGTRWYPPFLSFFDVVGDSKRRISIAFFERTETFNALLHIRFDVFGQSGRV